MKKSKSLLSVIAITAMISASTSSFAAEGDIINTGNKIIYKLSSAQSSDELDRLLKDIEDEQSTDEFLTEDSEGKFYNPGDKLSARRKALGKLLAENGINLSNGEEIMTFVVNNIDNVSKAMNEAEASVSSRMIDLTGYVSGDESVKEVTIDFTDAKFMETPVSIFRGTIIAKNLDSELSKLKIQLFTADKNIAESVIDVDGNFTMQQFKLALLGDYEYKIVDQNGEVIKKGDPREISIVEKPEVDKLAEAKKAFNAAYDAAKKISTEGKTAESIVAYNKVVEDAKLLADAAKTEAEVATAKAKLDAAKNILVDEDAEEDFKVVEIE